MFVEAQSFRSHIIAQSLSEYEVGRSADFGSINREHSWHASELQDIRHLLEVAHAYSLNNR